MMRRLFLSFFIACVVGPAAYAHTLGVDRGELVETSPGIYRLTAQVPARIAPAILSPLFAPCTKPPWGELVAIDLSGDTRTQWRFTLGTLEKLMPVRYFDHSLRRAYPTIVSEERHHSVQSSCSSVLGGCPRRDATNKSRVLLLLFLWDYL